MPSSPTDTNALAEATDIEAQPRYNIPWGRGGFDISTGLQGVYVDNVFLTHTAQSDDYLIVPEANVTAFFPLGLSNSAVLDLGVAYYQYTRNTSLNTGAPLINPNSELGFNLQTGDFTFGFTERFSYQESPVYETGAEFFNIYNSGRFDRYDNRAGVSGTWDLHDLALSAGYSHENLFAETAFYDYVNHSSELAHADAICTLLPTLKAGLETAGSLNHFEDVSTNDSWRARLGPLLRWDISQFIKARMGAGYERIQYDSTVASALGISPENTYYAYAGVDHEINPFFSHSLYLSRDNQLGYQAGNLEGTHVSYSLTWRLREPLTLTPHATVIFFNESFGSGPPSLYHEKFTYVLAGLTALYRLGQHWQAGLKWDYRLKHSEIELAGYAQNQAGLELTYQF